MTSDVTIDKSQFSHDLTNYACFAANCAGLQYFYKQTYLTNNSDDNTFCMLMISNKLKDFKN